MKGYMFLSISIVGEIFGTMMLKMSEGFTQLLPSIGVVIGYLIAFYCLSLCLTMIPLSLAYAIWSGVGTALTVLIGVLLWDDPFNILTLVGIILIIGGVAFLNTASKPQEVKGQP